MKKVAALLTSFNRKEITIRCLNRLFSLKHDIDVYLVDDKSTDGTDEVIRRTYPDVSLISGTGNLFWNRGMCLAWQHAAEKEYDFYLWLNDDVLLYDDSLTELFQCSLMKADRAIISGLIEDAISNEILYGGTDASGKLIKPNGTMQEIYNLNGNVVLVPKYVFEAIGGLDPIFHHDLGDVDYGLRAKKNEIEVLATRVTIGSGLKNKICRVRAWNTDIGTRFRKLYSPLGSPPGINFRFRQRHYGLGNAITYFVFIHLLNLSPDALVKKIFGDKYIA